MEIGKSFLRKTRINVVGCNNIIIFGEKCYSNGALITIMGDNNSIYLGNNVYLKNLNLHFEDDNGSISIGNNTAFSGYAQLACIEGKAIKIGSGCLFSSEVMFRVGDSHSILDMAGRRINPSQDIIVGDHVWFGNKTTLLKGASIANDSIIGAGSIVAGKFTQPNVIIAGVPGRIIKKNIGWDEKRI